MNSKAPLKQVFFFFVIDCSYNACVTVITPWCIIVHHGVVGNALAVHCTLGKASIVVKALHILVWFYPKRLTGEADNYLKCMVVYNVIWVNAWLERKT